MKATKAQRDCPQPTAGSLQPVFQYHPSGWRVWKGSAPATLYLHGPGGQLLTKSGTPSTDYVYFAGRLLFTMSEGSFDPRLTKLTRMYSDRLGSTRATTVLTYGGGSTTRNYYPFGEEITSTANNTYKFASTYRDSATGLDYAMMRYYASGTGRFLSTDPYRASGGPADPQGLNRYTYAENDPVNFRDPTGLLRCGDDGEGCEPQEADPDALGGLTTCIWVPISQGLLSSGVWVCSGNSSNQLGTPRPAPLSCRITSWSWNANQAGLQTVAGSTGYLQPVALTVQAQGGNP